MTCMLPNTLSWRARQQKAVRRHTATAGPAIMMRSRRNPVKAHRWSVATILKTLP